MKISTRGRYALRLMIDLAEHADCGTISLKEISERQNISKKYLEQIIPFCVKAELVTSVRGAQGGYMLAKSPELITAGEILRLTEGTLTPVACAGETSPACARSVDCPALPVWRGLAETINTYLDGITLQDILDQQRALGLQSAAL